jgi:hypothetical protein
MQFHAGADAVREGFKEWLWLETNRKSDIRNSGCA